MKIDYETPELIAAKYGKFVQGASAPGGNADNGDESGGLEI